MTKKIGCAICKKEFHPLGFMRHRAMHRDKAELLQKHIDVYIDKKEKLS